MAKTFYGGQAVIEGVMMRGKNVYSVAVRTPEGNITVERKDNESLLGKHNIFKYPIFRGMASFVDSTYVGTKILTRSAFLAGEELDEEPSEFEKKLQAKFGEKLEKYIMYFSVFLSILLSVGLFFMLPVWIGSFVNKYIAGTYMLGIVEGLIRIMIFLVYIFLISRMKEIKRLFEYHGAEHKTINCFEAGKELNFENVKNSSRLHKRCGTSFLLIVMVVSMLVFIFVRTDVLWLRMLSREIGRAHV